MLSLRLRRYGRIHAIPLHIRAISSTPTPRVTFQVPLTGVILGVGVVGAFVYANYRVTQFKKQCTQWVNTTRDAATGVWNAAADGLKSGKSKAAEVKMPSIETPQFLKTTSTNVWNAAADGLKSGKSKAAEVTQPQFLKTLVSRAQDQPPTPSGGKAISARIADFLSPRTKE